MLCIGDSANDEPMFRALPLSVGGGGANIHHSLPWLSTLPAYQTTAEGGQGFAEMAGHLLRMWLEANAGMAVA